MLRFANSQSSPPLVIWLVGVSFVLFQFFLQLSSGVVIDNIMHETNLSALTAGLLSATLYVIYTALQIPVGILFDCKNTRTLIAVNAVICSMGCFIFSESNSLVGLFIGRFLMGGGAAFAFVGLSHLLRQHFSARQFPFMIGLSETLGFAATGISLIGLGALLSSWGWRHFIFTAGCLGLVIAYQCAKKIPQSKPMIAPPGYYTEQLISIFFNKKAWINGAFVGLSFTVVTVFGALWGIPFIQSKLACNLQQASLIDALFFLGAGISCPLFGYLSTIFTRRQPLILLSCFSTTGVMIIILYWPIHDAMLLALLLLTLGICCGSYMLAYTISNELAPSDSSSTYTGFTNTLAVVTTPILQTLIGYLLDTFSPSHLYTLSNYQMALLTIPVCLLLSGCLALFLPEKPSLSPLTFPTSSDKKMTEA